MTCRKLLYLGAMSSALVLARRAAAQNTPVRIDVMRKHQGADCNSGYISVAGTVVAYTLERPTADNQPLFSAIPIGRYSAQLRYDHNDHWRLEFKSVPGRSNIQIHIGNLVEDTIGCVLIGKTIGTDLCSLGKSREAYATFKQAVYNVAEDSGVPPEVGVIVTISDA